MSRRPPPLLAGSRQTQNFSTCHGAEVIHRVPGLDVAVAARLWELHDRGWLPRGEIEAALGLDPPPGRWECPGQFGVSGKWQPCCRGAAA